MKFRMKMTQLFCVLLDVGILCSCADNVNSNAGSTISKRKLPQISLNYGTTHNDLLDECLEYCNMINPNDYIISNVNDPDFYALYAEYANLISQTVCNYMELDDYEAAVIPNSNGGNQITTPQAFEAAIEIRRLYIENNFNTGAMALNLVENLFDHYLTLGSEFDIEEDPYWMNLTDSIEIFAEDIYSECEIYCANNDERQSLEIMLSVVVGSCAYWTDSTRFAQWRQLAWNANCAYLSPSPEGQGGEGEGGNGEGEGNSGDEQHEENNDNNTELKQKVRDFIITDGMAALSAAFLGPECALAAAGFFSAVEALSWP